MGNIGDKDTTTTRYTDPSTSSAFPYVELHAASAFSFLRSGSAVEALVARAAALGMPALALTDYMTLAGVVRFQAACAEHGIQPIVGAELAVADPNFGDVAQPAQFVVLAQNATGYANLCQMLTDANLADPERPLISLAALTEHSEGLFVLTGGREGTLTRLLQRGLYTQALEAAHHYAARFGVERVFVELQHHLLPDSRPLMQQLIRVVQEASLRAVVTNGVRYASREDYPVYDLLTCTRLGITVDEAHVERPLNDEAYLKGGDELRALVRGLPGGAAALAATTQIAAQCRLSLLKGVCIAPRVPLPEGQAPAMHLRALCEQGLATRYASIPEALALDSQQWRQMAHELEVIRRLELEEFFLVVHDTVATARAMGIRCSGRGSAANSLVAYLLGITGVDPIAHGLLFERFLNPERRGMPDIDIDVQSDRREELIRYVERTYSERHAAMVANVNTYRPRGALRDATKALGFPLPLVNALTKVLPHHAGCEGLAAAREELREIIHTFAGLDEAQRAHALDRLDVALQVAPRMLGLPRHLSLHNGGIVLTREPLSQLLPVRISANGVRALEVDKDDVERLGLIKFDVLGLRTLGAVEEALALIEETTGKRPDIDRLPTQPPDERTMQLVRAGQTLAVFQIESPGQWHLLAQTQPQTFDNLIVQTALFRPGPIIGGFVRPYVAARQRTQDDGENQEAEQLAEVRHRRDAQHSGQRDAVQTPWHGAPSDDFWTIHPILREILRDTEGILLFQEQILEIAHQFAGLSYADADGFRRAMSHAREPEEMEAMRERFVTGAMARDETAADATRVFEAISAFVGYGFCKSHAAEFARTIYQTAWLKAHYSAHYLAAFLSVQPAGFFPPHVIVEEAKQLGIPVLGVDINRSAARFSVERVGSPPGRWAIRIGLAQVAQIGEELAEAIVWERRRAMAETGFGVSLAAQRAFAELPYESRRTGSEADSSPQIEQLIRGDQYEMDTETDAGDAPAAERRFTSLSDVCLRLRPHGLSWQAAEALVAAGACDGLKPVMERRQRLWQLHELWPLVGSTRPTRAGRGVGHKGCKGRGREESGLEQAAFAWEVTLPRDGGLSVVPALPALEAEQRVALDYQLLGLSARPHPMRLLRRELRQSGIRAIADLSEVSAGRVVRVAGWPISAQRPPTAHGMGFLVLEDETGRLPVALPPRLAAQMYRAIRGARAVVVSGRVERVRWYHSLLALALDSYVA